MDKLVTPNKKGGIVTGTIWAIGGLVIAVILILVVTSTIFNANLLGSAPQTTFQVNNESLNGLTQGWWLNHTDFTLKSYNTSTYNFARVFAINQSSGLTIPTSNYTISTTGLVHSLTFATINWTNVTFTYTYVQESGRTDPTDVASRDLQGNFTKGIGNVSSKVPTILLLVAVVFLFGALVLLLRQAQGFGIFSGNGGGSL
jgi:hypothetical protein